MIHTFNSTVSPEGKQLKYGADTSLLLWSGLSSYTPVLQTFPWIGQIKIHALGVCIKVRFWMNKDKNVFFKEWKKVWGKCMFDF